MVEKTHGVSMIMYVDDVEKTANFWKEAFGAEIPMTMRAPDGTAVHSGAQFGNTFVMMGPTQMPAGGRDEASWKEWTSAPRYNAVQAYINVPDVKAVYDKAKAAGVHIEEDLTDQFWGDRTFMVHDNNGFVVTFAEKVKDVSPEEMAEVMRQMADG